MFRLALLALCLAAVNASPLKENYIEQIQEKTPKLETIVGAPVVSSQIFTTSGSGPKYESTYPATTTKYVTSSAAPISSTGSVVYTSGSSLPLSGPSYTSYPSSSSYSVLGAPALGSLGSQYTTTQYVNAAPVGQSYQSLPSYQVVSGAPQSSYYQLSAAPQTVSYQVQPAPQVSYVQPGYQSFAPEVFQYSQPKTTFVSSAPSSTYVAPSSSFVAQPSSFVSQPSSFVSQPSTFIAPIKKETIFTSSSDIDDGKNVAELPVSSVSSFPQASIDQATIAAPISAQGQTISTFTDAGFNKQPEVKFSFGSSTVNRVGTKF